MKILNADSLKAVSATYVGDEFIDFAGVNAPIVTNDGYPYFVSDVMNSVIDVKSNKYSFFGLTSAMNTTDLLADDTIEISTVGPVALNLTVSGDLVLGVDPQSEIVWVDILDDEAILINLDHVASLSGDNYYILNYRNTVLSLDVSDEIYFGTYIGGNGQHFRIVDGISNTIKLQTPDGRFANWGGAESFRGYRDLQPIDLYAETITEFTGYQTTNKWVRYENFYAPEYSTTPSILTVDDANSISAVPTSFILNAPLESIEVGDNSASIPFDMIPTKDFKTIASELSLIPTSGVSGADLVDFRDYKRIYTGGNQIGGYANINLGYSSDYSSVINFGGDKFTYFHFPKTAPEIVIQEAGLEFAGAFAGVIPEFSDRIYKRLANYDDMGWWGGGSHNGKQDGTWLCAWLSGGEDDTSEWVERYYNPGIITSEGALSAGGGEPTFEYVPNVTPYWDVVSDMTLEPGAYYRYYHVGNGGFEKILESLKGITDDNLVIQLSDFTLGNIVPDESGNDNYGYISNYENADVVTLDIGFGSEEQSAILLNGNSEVQVAYSPVLNVADTKSISSWIYSRDWANGRSSTLFTNYYKGGDKFEYMNHGLYYAYMVPNAEFDAERFTVIPSEISTSGDLIDYDGIDGNPVSVAIDLDGFQWAATYIAPTVEKPTGQTLLFKSTSSGRTLESASIDPNLFGEVAQLLIKDDNVGYMVDVDGEAKEFDLHDIKFTGVEYSIGSDYAFINISGDFDSQSGNVVDMDQFDDGVKCTIQGNVIHLDVDGIDLTNTFDLQTLKHVVCDDDKYYFVTTYDSFNTLRLHKLNRYDDADIEYSGMTGDSASINTPFITKESVEGTVRSVIYWVGKTTINRYFINDDGEMELINTVTSGNFEGTVNGDFSGYKLNKIIHKLNGSKPYLKYSVLLGEPPDARKETITYSADLLSDNWHYFAIIKDNPNISIYVDGKYATGVGGVTEDILYLTGSMLNIGGASDGSDPLFELLGLTNRDIDGGVSEFSIFNIALEEDDVKSLYLSKFSGNDDMEWVVNNGRKNFVEEFQNVFKFKKPGIKSQFLNVVVKNLDLTDEEKDVYEAYIRNEIDGLLPANIKMVNVIWR